MTDRMNYIIQLVAAIFIISPVMAQKAQPVKFVKNEKGKKIDVLIGGQAFTSFIYTDTIEKPFLYPIYAANGTMITRGFPWNPKPGELTDHPHHIGLWLNYESVNGLDFWNNSFAIPAERKKSYGWIKTDNVLNTTDGAKSGTLTYHANWTNQANDVLLEETTKFVFSGTGNERVIDRFMTLKAATDVLLADVKDGMLGLRLARELQIPAVQEKKFTDDKGNVTVVKANADSISNGNYITSEGIMGDAAWSTRAAWCKVYGKMQQDSISVTIFDHEKNLNYPTFWHARGYGLFAANPLGMKVFTNGKSETQKKLKKGEEITFYYRITIDNGKKTPTNKELNKRANAFSRVAPGVLVK